MPLTIRYDDRKIRKALKGLSDPQVKRILKQAADSLLRQQRARVELEGRGSSGKALRFKGKIYSESYAERRRESGRPTEKRTLSWTGRMHQARKVLKVTAQGALLGWKPGSKHASKAVAQQRMTPFTQATKDEDRSVRQLIRALILRSVGSNRSGGSSGKAAAGRVVSSPER